MGEYGGVWRGSVADARRAPSPPGKRNRRDYGDYDLSAHMFGTPMQEGTWPATGLSPETNGTRSQLAQFMDDVAPVRSAYGSTRGVGVVPAGPGREVGVYTPRGERGYDDVRGAQGGWREGDIPGGTADLVRDGYRLGYAVGGIGNDLAITGGPGIGMNVPGAGSLASLGIAGIGDNPALLGQGGRMSVMDIGLGGRQGTLALNGVAPEKEVLQAAHDMLPPDAASTLFVDGLPLDCTRREAAHIFRPFIGFKEVRLVQKDTKRVVLCFVEFADARCAATALEALQGYKFDETDPESYALRLSFARYPGSRGPPARDDSYRSGRDRGADYADRRRGPRR